MVGEDKRRQGYKAEEGSENTMSEQSVSPSPKPTTQQAVSLAARAGDFDVPVQVIWGSDNLIIPADHAGNIAGAAVHIIDDAGHMPMMEKAAEVNKLIQAFIG